MSDLPPPSPFPAPNAQPVPPSKPSWWKRKAWKLPAWAWIVVGALIIGAIGATAGGGDDDTATASSASSTTRLGATTTVAPISATTTTSPPPTTAIATTTTTTTTTSPTTTLPPTTTTTLPPEPIVISGRGDDVVEVPESSRVVLHATHSGRRNFIVVALDGDLQRLTGAVNVIGAFEGRVLLNVSVPQNLKFFEVQADGAWTLEMLPVTALTTFDADYSSAGQDVVLYMGPARVMHLTHDGARNFIVRVIGPRGPSGLVNEIGAYDGRVAFPAGPSLVSIVADGSWTIGP